MGYLKYLRQAWNTPTPEQTALWRERLIQWRAEPVTVRIAHPTRLDRARSLGYKAKGGFVIVRQCVRSGGRQKPKFSRGRKPSKMRRINIIGMSYQWIAEQRAARKYPNLEVLNSYFVAKDSKSKWYEIILIDPHHPEILSDVQLRGLTKRAHANRVFRGLTASGKRSRGLLTHKGKGAEKLRPSLRANKGRAK
ncbi:MAG TPA: 50S ribosomal protein L15e [Candidatus Nanoarchaeia archaeon]|nr:50S ribosomal protein L15e [Candidatus Nanoarchaeia archaeon]